MIWNNIFWIIFAVMELVLLSFLFFSFHYEIMFFSAILMILGACKLAEDMVVRKQKGRTPDILVRKRLLKKLK